MTLRVRGKKIPNCSIYRRGIFHRSHVSRVGNLHESGSGKRLGNCFHFGGWRNHILLSDALRAACTACVIDRAPRKLEQPSDHTPVIATIEG